MTLTQAKDWLVAHRRATTIQQTIQDATGWRQTDVSFLENGRHKGDFAKLSTYAKAMHLQLLIIATDGEKEKTFKSLDKTRDWLVKQRKKHKLTQEQHGELMKMALCQLRDYDQGRTTFTLTAAERYATSLEIALEIQIVNEDGEIINTATD